MALIMPVKHLLGICYATSNSYLYERNNIS